MSVTIRAKPNCRFRLFVALSGMLLVSPLSAVENNEPARLFNDNSEMKVTLSGPWRTIRNRVKKDDRYPAQLTYKEADGTSYTLDVEVAPRGLSRRFRVCDFPPLKIHFDKKQTKDTEFEGNKSLKLVTYCKTGSEYEQYYIKEYLIYRIYNVT